MQRYIEKKATPLSDGLLTVFKAHAEQLFKNKLDAIVQRHPGAYVPFWKFPRAPYYPAARELPTLDTLRSIMQIHYPSRRVVFCYRALMPNLKYTWHTVTVPIKAQRIGRRQSGVGHVWMGEDRAAAEGNARTQMRTWLSLKNYT